MTRNWHLGTKLYHSNLAQIHDFLTKIAQTKGKVNYLRTHMINPCNDKLQVSTSLHTIQTLAS